VASAVKYATSEQLVRDMILKNEHNKFTTLYYLLVAKKSKNEFDFDIFVK
jgi:hypothetical protein